MQKEKQKKEKSRENPQKQQVLCSSRLKHVSSDEISCLFVQEGSRKKENVRYRVPWPSAVILQRWQGLFKTSWCSSCFLIQNFIRSTEDKKNPFSGKKEVNRSGEQKEVNLYVWKLCVSLLWPYYIRIRFLCQYFF